MRKQSIEIIKDLFISILLVACIVLVLSVIFYDKISLSKVIPESDEYMLSNEMQEQLEESQLDAADEIIINYYIDAADLKKYEKTNEYVKGKSNPFAVENVQDSNNTNSSENTQDPNNGNLVGGNTSNNNGSGGFYEDDGTK